MQKLLPSEVHDYYIRNGIRADGRDLLAHRNLHVVRKVLANKATGNDIDQVSCSIKLGQTHLLCSLKVKKEQVGITVELKEPLLVISINGLQKDQGAVFNVRRDVIEEKELLFRQALKQKITASLGPWQKQNEDDTPPELSFSFTIMADDGNVSSALVAASQDLLDQAKLLKNHVYSCLMVLHETRYMT